MSVHSRFVVVALLIAGFACQGSPADPNYLPGPTDQWVDLIGRSWSVPAGSEIYLCRRIQATNTWAFGGFRTTTPAGQHRLIVSASSNQQSTGDFNCTSAAPPADSRVLFSTGIGTGEMTLPAGVGMRVPGGHYVTLQIHVVNGGTAAITGTSTVAAYSVPDNAVTTEAELTFVGPASVSVPAQTTGHVVRGGCPVALDDPWQIYALLPIMRELGTHQEIESVPLTGTPVQLHNAPFNLSDQPLYTLPSPFTAPGGAFVRVSCTYTNPTNSLRTFGDSSTNEICYAGVYHSPATSGGAFCVSDDPIPVTSQLSPLPKRSSSLAS